MTDTAQLLDRLLARAETDPPFRSRLMADPSAVFAEEGASLPAGVTVSVVEDTATHLHLVLPCAPAEGGLTDQDLDAVAGGFIRPPPEWGAWLAFRARLRPAPTPSAAPADTPPTGHTDSL